jgi:hypothetical protein
MNHTFEQLELLAALAGKDPELRGKLLATRSAPDPTDAFCKIACKAGYPLTVGELFETGEEYCDNQCKSTNGGNPTPYESFCDTYEIFLSALE